MAGSDPILVAGGGIGGMAAALAVRAAGLDATVYERGGERREVGAGLTLWPNAMGALDRLGVGDAVRAHAVELPDMVIDVPDGRVLTRFASDRNAAVLGGPTYAVHRAELLDVLAAALGPPVMRLRTPVSAVADHDDGTASLTTASGKVVHGAGVIGADGVASLVARWMHPATTPRYAGWTAWRGIAHFRGGSMPGHPYAETWGRDGRRFGTVPLSDERIYWYATANRPEGERAESPRGEHAGLVRALGAWHPPVAAVLDATDPDSVLRHDVYDRPPLPTWVRAGVCVLGDAAHPMQPNLGQGACQTLEDAGALGACLAAETSIPAAFARFETQRKRRAEHVVALSRRLGRTAQHGGAFGALRDLGVRVTPAAVTVRRLRRFAARARTRGSL